MPFRFLGDIATADVAFEAWGESREELFSACAAALLKTMVEEPDEVQRLHHVVVKAENHELDLLLYSFLEDLVFYKDARRLLLHADRVAISGNDGNFWLEATTSGEEINPQRHKMLVDVKAVTLHRFHITFEDNLWKATVVLDV